MQAIGEVFRSCWNILFSATVPQLGISFGALYLGIFVAAISLRVLMPLLGIAGGTAKGLSSKRRDSGKSDLTTKRKVQNQNYSYHAGQTIGTSKGGNALYTYKVNGK